MSVTNSLVDKYFTRTSLLEHITEKKAKQVYKPVITISREAGSGGHIIAEKVAKKLGFKLHDDDMLDKLAKVLKIDRQVVEHLDEHSRTGVMDAVQAWLNPDYVSVDNYFRALVQVMYKMVAKGGCVIVGRGANFIVPNAYSLEVDIVAPYRVRVAKTVEFEGLSQTKARERIAKVSAEREAFIEQYFGKNPRDAKYFDLSINTAFLPVNKAVDLVIDAYKAKFKIDDEK